MPSEPFCSSQQQYQSQSQHSALASPEPHVSILTSALYALQPAPPPAPPLPPDTTGLWGRLGRPRPGLPAAEVPAAAPAGLKGDSPSVPAARSAEPSTGTPGPSVHRSSRSSACGSSTSVPPARATCSSQWWAGAAASEGGGTQFSPAWHGALKRIAAHTAVQSCEQVYIVYCLVVACG